MATTLIFSDFQWDGTSRPTGIPDGVADTDAVNVRQLNAAVRGLDWKASVRVATTANIVALTGPQVIDGMAVVTGDRVLVKNQTVGQDNGIYDANTAGAWTRSSDADVSAEVTSGMAMIVSEGTTQADQAWFLTTNDPIVLGTTPLVFAKFGSGAGLTKFAQTYGTGVATTFVINHNLNSNDSSVTVYDIATGIEEHPQVTHSTINTVTVIYSTAPALNSKRIVVMA